MINVKDIDVLNSMIQTNCHPIMVNLVNWIFLQFGKVTLTCGHRPGDKGVHGTDPYRGVDIRSWIYSDPQGIVKKINKAWDYNHPTKKHLNCAIYHDSGSGDHIHLQVRDSTTNIF